MKKIILSIATAGILVSGLSTSAMASNTSALTKATVKLIKENRKMNQQVTEVQEAQADVNVKIEQNKVLIKTLTDDNTTINERINTVNTEVDKNKALGSSNSDKIKALNMFKEATGKNLDNINKIMLELSKKVGFSEDTLETISKNSTDNSSANQDIATSLKLLQDEFAKFKENANKDLNNLSSQNSGDETSIKSIQKELLKLQGENKNLKELLENYKIFTDAEIKVLKTKLNRAKPVYFMQEKEAGCVTGKCAGEDVTDADAVIKNYIK